MFLKEFLEGRDGDVEAVEAVVFFGVGDGFVGGDPVGELECGEGWGAVDGEDDCFEFVDLGVVDEAFLLKEEGRQRTRVIGELQSMSQPEQRASESCTVTCSSLQISAFP